MTETITIRRSLLEKRKEMRKQISCLENYFLDDITHATLHQGLLAAEFDLNHLATGLKSGKNRIYATIKKLKSLQILLVEDTGVQGIVKLGLNPEFFGTLWANE